MPITGGIKFFDENPALYSNGGAILASSGQVVANYCIDKLPYTYYRSVGSNDATTETLILQFGSTTISRLLLLDHNWKGYVVKYWNGSAYVHFSGVVGLDGALSNITETNFADDSSYYEFTPVTTTGLQITITTTQTANAEKYIATIFPTSELYTLQGYPVVSSGTLDPRARVTEMLSGRVKITKQRQVFSVSLQFNNYPVLSYGADIDAMLGLIARESVFHIWLCGGRRGSNYFSYPLPPWRLKDCYRVQTDSAYAATWTENIYKNGQNLGELLFKEHV